MRILMVSRLFPPKNEIGAVRPGCFAAYLAEFGHEVFCVTGGTPGPEAGKAGLKVFRVPGRGDGRAPAGRAGRRSGRREQNAAVLYLKKTVSAALHIAKELAWVRAAYPVCEEILKTNAIDCVLTSYGPLSSVLLGRRIQNRFPSLPWVSDMRDPLDSLVQVGWRRRLNAALQRDMLRRADLVTTVSDALAERFRALCAAMDCGTPVRVVVNGYEPAACRAAPAAGALRIGYTGILYGGLRRMDALFAALRRIDEAEGAPAAIELHYAGPDGAEVAAQAESCGAGGHLICHGPLPHEEALRLQESCDVLCVLSWSTGEETGVLTGKFPEYMRLRRPILALISGDAERAELSDRLAPAGDAGFDYRYIRGEAEERRLVGWLTELYRRKQAGEPLPRIPEAVALPYGYPLLARQLEGVLVEARKAKEGPRANGAP